MSDSNLYAKLGATAKEFVLSTSPKTAGTNEPDAERFYATLAPEFRMSWGHKFFVANAPPLQGSVDGEGFLKHQSSMAPKLSTWRIEVTQLCVDVEQRSAVLRGDFFMFAKGQSEHVLNDILFWIVMDEAGEKVRSAMEFVDAAASGELRKHFVAAAGAPS